MVEDRLARCIECGCDDDYACDEGCFWLRVDREAGLGVCSSCEARLKDWDAGDRNLDMGLGRSRKESPKGFGEKCHGR